VLVLPTIEQLLCKEVEEQQKMKQ